jgi:hypothetical protein
LESGLHTALRELWFPLPTVRDRSRLRHIW